MEFSIDSLKGKVQIVAYLAKSVPDQFKSRSILDLRRSIRYFNCIT